jgi:DivIVA domain-containing protein
MVMTPEDVNNVKFSKPRFGRRGYDEASVDAFLDGVMESLSSMQDRIDELERRLASRLPRL